MVGHFFTVTQNGRCILLMAFSSSEITVIHVFQPVFLGLQFGDVHFCQKFSRPEQPYPVANLLNLIQMVGREKYGHPVLIPQLPDEIHKFLNSGRIDTGRGFIENDDFRFLDQYIG